MSLIKLKETPEQIELIKAMGSKNLTVSREASEAVAAFLGPVIKKVLLTLGTSSAIYRDAEFDEDADPSLPLDLFFDQGEGFVTTWSQSQAGGLPTSTVNGISELKFQTYRIDSAVSFNKRYARKHRLDVVSKAIERMVNEVLIKQERNAWAVILKALAEATTTVPTAGSVGVTPATYKHVISSNQSGQFLLSDLNRLMTRVKRINESYSANTPISPFSNGPTDLYVSPEIKEQIRAFAYNPINTAATASTTRVGAEQYLSDDLRNDIYRNAGMQSIFGVVINELVELGDGHKYNTLFGNFGTSVVTAGGMGNSPNTSFSTSNDEIVIAIDNSRGSFIRPVSRQAESGGTFSVLPDGQWDGYGARVEKVGFYGFVEEGRLCIDARAVAGIAV